MSDRMDRFEQGLDALRIRHQAMADTTELLQGMIRDMIAAQQRLTDEMDKRFAQTDQQIASLLSIARVHERRLTALEGGKPE